MPYKKQGCWDDRIKAVLMGMSQEQRAAFLIRYAKLWRKKKGNVRPDRVFVLPPPVPEI